MISFRIRAEGGTRVGDRAEVRRALALLISPGDRHELRALPGGACRIAEGDDLDAAADAAIELSDRQVYYSLNPIRPDADRANTKTVLRRVWFLVDVDPVRPRDVSSSDAEKAEAYQVVAKVAEFLLDLGWPAPLIVDSGNGWHLLCRVDLPNSKLAQQLLKAALAELARRFDTLAAVVDQKTHDAPRISKLPGTWAMKGPDTADRPHRMSRIHYEPDRLDVVEAHQITALATPAPDPATAPASSPPTGFATVASDGPGKAAYVRSAIERECYRVLIATERNNALNRAAFALGQFTSWPEMNEQQAKAMLKQAAERAGLDRDTGCGPAGILKTIASGWDAGKQQPRPRPVDPAVNGKAANGQAKPTRPSKLTIGAHEIKPEAVEWIVQDRIARRFISLFAGRTGVGKSFVTCDIVARLSRGMPGVDGTPPQPITGTLFISEDPYRYVLVPRLIELGADLNQIGFMQWEAMADYQLADTDYLEQAWLERGKPGLIVIDPPTNFLGGKDEHKNAEVRSVLMKVVAWLESRPVGMVLITHYNKGGAQKALDALDRIMGSVAWASSSRIACGFIAEPGDQSRCIFGGIKNNLGPKATPLSYRIVKTDSLAKVEWLGTSETSFDDAMSQAPPKKANVAKFFVERFREKLEWESEDLIEQGRKNGFNRNDMFAAKSALGVDGRQLRGAGGRIAGYIWFVTAAWKWFQGENRDAGDAGTVAERNYHDSNNIGESDQRTDQCTDRHDAGGESPAYQRTSVPRDVETDAGSARQVINEIFKPF